MAKMSEDEIKEHNKNPNILLKVDGERFRCQCGCNVFHHIDDDEIFVCNSCESEYDCRDDAE